MKYLVLYIFIIFTLYVYLKYYCYIDQKNILNNDINLKYSNSYSSSIQDVNSLSNVNISDTQTEIHKEPYCPIFVKTNNIYDDYEYPLKKTKEFYSNVPETNLPKNIIDNIKWKGFGTDITSDYVKQKKSEFREISTPNISIEKFHFRDNIESITEQDRLEIALSNLIVPKVIETYDNISGKPKIKSFGLALKTQFNSVNNLSKTFRSIRFKSDIQLPKEFNGPQIWKDYLTPINDQGSCGNCWAHASSAVLADRFAILSLGKIKFVPSPYEMTVCSFDFKNNDIKNVWKNEEQLQIMDKFMHENRSCNGNNLYDTATTLFTDGVTEKSCFPDKFNTNGKLIDIGNIQNVDNLPYCYSVTGIELDTCIDKKTPMRKYRCKTAYICSKEKDNIYTKEKKLMYDIYKYGPVIVGMMLFPDFINDYDGKTIYTHHDKSSGEIGGHAVRLVGWGEENVNGQLIKYWWVANSWGTDWGLNGYFRIKRCMSEIQLEDNVMSVLPDFPGMIIEDPNLEAVESEKDKEIQNFTGHFLDKTTGYYNTSIEKIKKCEIRGKMFPYINENFIKYLPNYKEFFASKVSDYISSKNINNVSYSNDIPVHYCNQDYTPPAIESKEIIPPPSESSIPSEPKNENQQITKDIKKTQETKKKEEEEEKEKKEEEEKEEKEEKLIVIESKFHKNICKIINYKYFDIIYFIISFIFGFIIYLGLYYNISVGNKSTTLTNNIKIKETDTNSNIINTIQSLNTPITPSISPM